VNERFALSQPTISHHLKILTRAGILIGRQEAQHHYISINRELIAEMDRQGVASLAALGPAALLRRRNMDLVKA
jgi:DNA-binding transcriptional ArsR family regulator